MYYTDRRKLDEQKEQTIAHYMDEIYRKLGFTAKREYRQDTQKQGVDVYLTKNGTTYITDEKAAVQYYDRDLQTFSMELETCNNYNHSGWFVSSNNINDTYCFIWPHSDDSMLTKNVSIDFALVKKEAIHKLFLQNDIDLQYAISHVKECGSDYFRYNGFKVVHSTKFTRESPVNILISKKTLFSISIENGKNINCNFAKGDMFA